MAFRYKFGGISLTSMSQNQWQPSDRLHDANTPSLSVLGAPEIQSSLMVDADRSWVTPFEDVEVQFSEAVADASLTLGAAATGFTITVNGVAQTTTYRSGSGTASWVLRAPLLVKNGDSVGVSYNKAAGATLAVSDSVEIETISQSFVTNNLSKRVRFTLRGSDNAIVPNETVKANIMEYAGGTVANPTWGNQTNKASVLTDAAGLFDMQYSGAAPVGGQAYIAVLRAVESFAAPVTIT